MQHAEHGRNEEQRCDRGDGQSADNRTPERRVLLAAFAERKSHRHHADNHGECRHQYGSEAGKAGFHRGGTGIEKEYVFTGPGSFTVNDDRATISPWGINGGRAGGRSSKLLVRAPGESYSDVILRLAVESVV